MAPVKSGEKATSFAMACSLLSRYIRQNGAAAGDVGLAIRAETDAKRTSADTENGETRKDTMDLFPQNAGLGSEAAMKEAPDARCYTSAEGDGGGSAMALAGTSDRQSRSELVQGGEPMIDNLQNCHTPATRVKDHRDSKPCVKVFCFGPIVPCFSCGYIGCTNVKDVANYGLE